MSEFLAFKSVGDPLPTREEWNDLVASNRNNLTFQDGNYDGIQTNVQTDRGEQLPYFTSVWKGPALLEPYSVVQIRADTPYAFIDPLIQNTIDYNDGPVFITNEDIGVNTDDPFVAVIIGQYPVKARYDSSNQPVVGEECGPDSSNQVSSKGSGLFCLSLPDPATEWLWVVSLGGGGGKSTQMGKLSGDVVADAVVTVPLVDEDLAIDGSNTQENVINITGQTLLDETIVYIFKQSGWPIQGGNDATHTMYPAQLAACPLVDPQPQITA